MSPLFFPSPNAPHLGVLLKEISPLWNQERCLVQVLSYRGGNEPLSGAGPGEEGLWSSRESQGPFLLSIFISLLSITYDSWDQNAIVCPKGVMAVA